MIRLPPRSTRTGPPFPYPPLCRSADMPFQADATPGRALDAATRLLQAGARMVKLEGADHKLEVIRFLVEREIPVCAHLGLTPQSVLRSEEHTSELQSLMRISYAVFCLQKKIQPTHNIQRIHT